MKLMIFDDADDNTAVFNNDNANNWPTDASPILGTQIE